MDLLKTLSLVILSILAPVLASDKQQHITTKTGEDCELQCRGPAGSEAMVLKWTRADLQLEDYVFLYSYNMMIDDHQHPSFSNRVQLRDPGFKTEDLSVVLKNVTTQDSGMYRCSALIDSSGTVQMISRYINLTVTEPEALEDRATEEEGGGTEGDAGRVMRLRGATGSYRVTAGHAVGVIVMLIAQSLVS